MYSILLTKRCIYFICLEWLGENFSPGFHHCNSFLIEQLEISLKYAERYDAKMVPKINYLYSGEVWRSTYIGTDSFSTDSGIQIMLESLSCRPFFTFKLHFITLYFGILTGSLFKRHYVQSLYAKIWYEYMRCLFIYEGSPWQSSSLAIHRAWVRFLRFLAEIFACAYR